ncbi:MAG TPA: class I SAM-dependent methyltransferase [Candidatus Acidoferrales bacterium]|nr:class I SAM-dependent methyltransferase [Candidatus Acidoferrales bacterium]
METSRWQEAQENELAIWQRTVNDVTDVFAEIAEAAALVRFGKNHGLAGAAAVVELGIGPMSIGWAAFAAPTRAIGVDPLPRLTIATGDDNVDRFVANLQQRTDFLQADATRQLPLDDGSFDLIVCDNVVDHTQDPKAILAEGRRIVRSDGRLLFGVNVFSIIGRLKWRQVTCRLHPRYPNVLCHPHSFLEGDLGGLLSSAGWEMLVSDDHRGARERLCGHAYRVRLVARPI